jgi:hypothetical protein
MRRALVLPLGALLILAGCDGLSGPKVGPPAAISLSPVPSGLEVGAVVPNITATVRDSEGREVGGATVTWSASHGTVSGSSRTDGNGLATATWTVGTVAGTQSITARAGNVEATRSVSVGPGPLARVVVAPETVTLNAVGDTVMLEASGEDQHGNTVTTAISWSSSAPNVASVLGGRVISQSAGTAVITATGNGLAGTANVVVTQVLAGLRVTPVDPVLVLGDTLRLSAGAVDARGSSIDTTVAVTWESSAPTVATINQNGVVTALAEGTAVMSARGGGHTGESTVRVATGERPSIASIQPSMLSPGDTATIRGAAFSATASENQVTVAGVAGQVLAATTTELRVAMPPPGAFPCGPTGNKPVVVTVSGLAAQVDHPVSVATQRSLFVGESVSFNGAGVACNELTSGGTYLVSVFNTSTVATGQSGFLLRGTAPTAAADATAGERQALSVAPSRSTAKPDPGAVAHLRVLEQNIRTARDLSARVTPRKRAEAHAFAVAAEPVGTAGTFRIPDLTTNTLCNSFKTVSARVVYSGPIVVIWEDEAAPLRDQMGSRWQEMGVEYEQVMHPIVLENFGDPLTYDAWVANPGRVHMLFSKEVNDFVLPGGGGVNAFVFSGDFFPRNSCGSSDERALFYARVPTVPGSGFDGNTAANWSRVTRSTVIHEVKHIVSFATRLRMAAESGGSATIETVWLEESTARLAEEFFGRAVMGYSQGGNTTYEQSIWCEVRVGSNFPDCDLIPLVMQKHFDGIYQYYRDVENRSPIGQVGTDFSFYGSGWLLVRWAMDHSNLSEAAFSKALVNEPQLTGVSNLTARAGRSFPDMLADFTLAMAVDDHEGGISTRPELTFPSWNTRDIMRGLNQDFPNGYTVPWPLAVRPLTFGDFDASVTGIRGGTAAFFRLTGPSGSRQMLELLSTTGSTAPSGLGVAIVRVN